jgi:hypothetical protein
MLIVVGAAWYVFSAAVAVATPPVALVLALALDATTGDPAELDELDDPQAATAILRPVAAKRAMTRRERGNTRPLTSRLEWCCMSLSSVLMGLVVSATWPVRSPLELGSETLGGLDPRQAP